jgi:hypothetical protein
MGCGWSALGAVAGDPQSRPATDVAAADDPVKEADAERSEYATESLRGKVVWLAEALERCFDVRVTEDAKERVLALETDSGELHPLIEDNRGRAFRTDERLRNREVELFVRRYQGVPPVQVIRTYTVKPDGKYLVDYWCDICAISMVEDGPCDCCQAHNELRERKVE